MIKMSSTESKARKKLSYYTWKTVREVESNHLILGFLCVRGEARSQKRDGECVYMRIRK